MTHSAVPSRAVEKALEVLHSLRKESVQYDLTFSEEDTAWVVFFLPSTPNRRGGDVAVWIAKENLDVLEVRRYQ